MQLDGHEVFPVDEGTMDTVLTVDGCRHSYDQEFAAIYRAKNGVLTDQGFRDLAANAVDDHGYCIEERSSSPVE